MKRSDVTIPSGTTGGEARPKGFARRVVDLYVDGFRSMTVGRKLWALIVVKLIFIFFVLKLLLMPDILSRDYDSDTERAAAVRTTLIGRTTH